MTPDRSPRCVFVGLATLDSISRVPWPPGRNEKTVAAGHELAAGGPATNAAVTCAALGGDALLVTSLGRHPLAEVARADLARHGVTVCDAEPDRAAPPPMANVTLTLETGERSVVLAPGEPIADPLDARRIEEITEIIGRAGTVLADGHHALLAALLPDRLPPTASLLLDAGSWKPVLAQLLPRTTIAACSADFRLPGTVGSPSSPDHRPPDAAHATSTTDHRPPGTMDPTRSPGLQQPAAAHATSTSDHQAPSTVAPSSSPDHRPPDAAHAADPSADLLRAGARAVLVTHGPEPVAWRTATSSGHVLVPRVAALDTLGAGDAFHGALAFAVAARPDLPLPELIGFANAVAAVRCRHVGVRDWLADPSLPELARSLTVAA